MKLLAYWQTCSTRTRFFIIAGIVILLGLIAHRHHHADTLDNNKAAPVVSTLPVTTSPWETSVTATGDIKAAESINVTSQVAGIIESIQFDSGQKVQQGQILATLRSDDLKASVKKLAATLQYDQEKYQQRAALLSKHYIAKTDVDAELAAVNADKAALQEATAQLAQYTIVAPYEGVLGIRQADVGQYLHAGDALVNLESLDPVYVDFQIPERTLPQIAVGKTIFVVSEAIPHATFTGTIQANNAHIDPDSRSLTVRAKVPNPNGRLLSGMAATVQIPIRHVQALVIPQTALGFDPSGTFVFVIDKQNIAHKVPVTIGMRDANRVVITSGLKAGDEIVSAGIQKCADGAPVAINNAISAPGSDSMTPITTSTATKTSSTAGTGEKS